MSVPDETFTVTPRPSAAGPYVLEVAGELDHHTAPLLTEAVNEAPFGPHGVVLDLSGLTFWVVDDPQTIAQGLERMLRP